MKINRNNYEIWFIDHFDGKLGPAENARLLLFLDENPDLKNEFEEFEEITVPDDEVVYNSKEKLKKPAFYAVGSISPDNYRDYFIGHYEGDLSEKELRDLESFLKKNPDLRSEFELFGKTFLTGDLSIQYPGKEKLEKPIFTGRRFVRYSTAIAAGLIILFGLYFVFKLDNPQYVRDQVSAVNSLQPNLIKGVTHGPEALNSPEIRQRTEEVSIGSIPDSRTDRVVSNLRLPALATTGEIQTGLNDHPPLIIIERYFLVNPSETGFNGELANQEPEKEKTRAGKVLSGLFKSAQSVFTKRLDEIDDRRPARFNIWNLASKGVESYNALTDNDVAFYQRINDEGKTVSVGLVGDDFHYQKDFNKE